MKKLKTLLVLLVIQGNVYSQGPIFGFDKGNILYRGYKNRVEFGTSDGRPFELLVEGGELISDTLINEEGENDSIIQFLLTNIRIGDTAKVFFLHPTTKEPFDTVFFKVHHVPDPSLYLGTISSGGTVSNAAVRSITELNVRYPPEVPIQCQFRIKTWEILSSTSSVVGFGSDLTSEAQSFLNSTSPGSQVRIIATIVGSDGIVRKISMSIMVN
jgi:hypothetical protein